MLNLISNCKLYEHVVNVACHTHLGFDSSPCVWVFLNFLNLCHEIVVQNKNSWRCTATIDFLILKTKLKSKGFIFLFAKGCVLVFKLHYNYITL